MSKPLPPLHPAQQSKVDEFLAGMEQLMDRFIAGFEMDANRHAVKHGPMPEDRMVFDVTRILAMQVRTGELTVNSLCGLLALSIVRGIAKKRQGRG